MVFEIDILSCDCKSDDSTLACAPAKTSDIASTPTRLAKLTDSRQKELINWGYAICDAALRAHVEPQAPAPATFPYPDAKLDG